MDTIIAIAILFAIGWAVSKSRLLSNLLDGFGLAMNWLWGGLFIMGGLWALFSGAGLWSLLAIGVGIYFFTTSRFDAKVSAVVEGAVDAVAGVAAEKLMQVKDGAPSQPAAGNDVSSGERRQCPQCAESIMRAASVCRFCGLDMSETLTAEASERTEQLMNGVRQQSALVQEQGNQATVQMVLELGRRWALAFDATGDPDHRLRALRAMSRAFELHGQSWDVDSVTEFFEIETPLRVEPFGSLMRDPEFAGFVQSQ